MAQRKTISQYPPDVTANILSSLPVKSLLRSKCVSKPWRSFTAISAPKAYSGSTSEDGSKGSWTIRSSWNPSTRESRPLPKPKHRPNGLFVYGLGYDFSADDYKLIRVACPPRRYPAIVSDKAKVEVLSMKTNVCRRIPDLKTDQMELDGPGIFLNGSLHFLARKVSGLDKNFSFDLAEEKFQEVVPLPDRLEENHYVAVLGLGVSGDCLCLFIGCGENLYEGWLMKEFGVKSSWTRLFSSLVDPWPRYKYWQTALCYTKNW
ncbi:hypothetical protein CRYUN_Cryun40dG0064700 [Craigia yunnanensis]